MTIGVCVPCRTLLSLKEAAVAITLTLLGKEASFYADIITCPKCGLETLQNLTRTEEKGERIALAHD